MYDTNVRIWGSFEVLRFTLLNCHFRVLIIHLDFKVHKVVIFLAFDFSSNSVVLGNFITFLGNSCSISIMQLIL